VPPIPNTDLVSVARSIALEAGALALQRRHEGVKVAATKSTTVDIVTEADRETERLILDLLARERRDDGVLGEEGASETGTSGLTWLVDPIDGTVNFLYGIPHWAVSIAVVEGEPDPLTWRGIAGAVFCPPTGELFTASEGGGAFLDDQPIRVAPAVELSQALVATGFAYDSWMRSQQGAVVTKLLPLVRDIRRQGTASLDLCFVGAGRYNAYFERTLSPWDHAAGAIVAREAGAVVKGWGNAAPSRDFIIAAEPTVASRLESTLEGVGAVDWRLRD
jgi:myo-inositol-1(or 4)-monophosphatase